MTAENKANQPELSKRLTNRITTYGHQVGIEEFGNVIQHITSQYPDKSIRDLAKETGFTRESIGQILRYGGATLLSKEEALEIAKQQQKGVYGQTREERQNFGSMGGFLKMSKEERQNWGRINGALTSARGTGIHAKDEKGEKFHAKEGGRQSAEKGVGMYGVDPTTGERFYLLGARNGGRKTVNEGIGIHGQTPSERSAHAMSTSELITAQKIVVGEHFFDSQEEAAVAFVLERYISGFKLERGTTYQFIIPGVQKKVDFVINGTFIEYNPIILWYSPNRGMGAFDTQEELDLYRTYRSSLDEAQQIEYKRQVIQGLKQRYYQRRREAINQNQDYVNNELIVLVDPQELYTDVICRFEGTTLSDYDEFISAFKSTLKGIKEVVKKL